MDSFNPTTKTQAALTRVLAGGDRRRQPADHARPPVDGTADPERWHCRPTVGGRRRRTSDHPRRDATPPRPAAQRQRRRLEPQLARAIAGGDHRRPAPGHRDGRRIRLDRAPDGRPGHRRLRGRQAADRTRRVPAGAARRVRQGARQRPRHQPRPRGHLPGAGEVLHRPDRPRPGGQARPGHRARQRDSSRRAGVEPSHQEQPGADRRARRRQDRDRGGPGPAHRGGRRAGKPARQDRRLAGPRFDGRRFEVPRRVRGAAQGRARRHQELRGPDHHVHRRAAHHRRRRRDRRVLDGRRQHDQADAGPRRAAAGRRHHARRVPQVHREGRRAGAPLPAGVRR